MNNKALLFGLALCGGLAFLVLSGGKLRLPFHHAAASPFPSSVAVGAGRLRFDGLYQGTTPSGSNLFLRFYPAGDVVTMGAQSLSVEEVADILSRHRPELARGTYRLHEASVSFVATNPLGSIDYEGSIGQEDLLCLVHSHITNREDTIRFGFHPASFPSD